MRSGITSSFVTSSAAVIRPVYCVYMDFSTGPVRLCNAINDTTIVDDFSGGTYTAVGQFGGIGAVTETTELSAKNMELTLSGIPSNYLTLALTDQYRGREVCVYLLLYNSTFSSYSKTIIFRGRMDTMTIQEGENTSTIRIQCESRLIQLQRPIESRYTNEEQKRLYPTDLGLEYLAASTTKDIYWGNAKPSTGLSNGGNSGGGYTGQGNYADYVQN